MFTLNLLGGAALTGLNGPVDGKAAHKRRIAVLAILALARGRTVGRERLIGLLWTDHRTAAARHLLSESLYVLRKELGADAFVSAGDEVGLRPGVLLCDVEAFAQAVEEGELERAARLYRGPFLEGFYVPGAPEFEPWAEAERARLARAHSRALECLAEAREGEGRPDEAAEWWRRLTVLDPSNSRVGMRLMTALDAAGERAAALWFAQSHVAWLDAELGVDPGGDFLDLVERLKTEPVRVPARPHPPLAADAATASRLASMPLATAAAAHGPGGAAGGAAEETPDLAAQADGAAGTGEAVGAASEAAAGIALAPAPAPVSVPDTIDPVDPVDPVDTADAADVADAVGAEAVSGRRPGGQAVAQATPPRAPGVRRGRRGAWPWRWRRQTWGATAMGVLLGAMLAFARRGGEAPAPPPELGGYDPRRIAVLYFDDDSRGGEMGYLASGLTESLIRSLSQVPALEVISRNGVKPYRHGTVPLARIVRDLQAGTVVEGSVQRSGGHVRVTVDMVDTRTQARVESRTLTGAVADVFALEDALADSVSVFLRRRVGDEVHLRRTGRETRSAVAWRLLMEAEEAWDDATALRRSDDALARDATLRLMGTADSLLAAAERADPAWTRPTVQRGFIALRRAKVRDQKATPQAALAFATRALARHPGDPLALELRGAVRFEQALFAVDSAGQAARVDSAEHDLRAAVGAEPTLASGWNRLSQVLRYRGRTAESNAMVLRALQEDAWLEDADELMVRLYYGALYTADYPRARAVCDQGHARFAADWRFVECRLTLLRADPSRRADPAAVRALLAELDRMDPPERARRQGRAYNPAFRMAVAAAVLARAGEADSARAMLARARYAVGNDPEMRVSLAYDEAVATLLLGRPDTARALLEWSFSRRPALRAFAARDPVLRRAGLRFPGETPPPAARLSGRPPP